MLHVLPLWGLLAHPPTLPSPRSSHSSSRFLLPVSLSAIAICGLAVTQQVPVKLNGARTPNEALIPRGGEDGGVVGPMVRKDVVLHMAEVASRGISTTDGNANFSTQASNWDGFL